jgi:NadR type nicotinamide-nucleotide adenylyltransferase
MKYKIAFTGPESTGKTTLSKHISELYNGVYVEEYAREYLEKTNGLYQEKDLVSIAEGQSELITQAENHTNQLLVSDTDLTVLMVWSLYKYKRIHPRIKQLLELEQFDLLFLCDIDTPWVFDPLREHPNVRNEILALYKNILNENNRNFILLSGSIEERLEKIKTHLKEKIK